MDAEGNFYRNNIRLNISELKTIYNTENNNFIINVPSSKILNRDSLYKFLQKLSDEGIDYQIFG